MVPDVSQWRSDAAYDYFDDSSVPDLCWKASDETLTISESLQT